MKIDYEQSLCVLIVRREWSEKKKGRAKVGRAKAGVWAEGEKKGTTDKASAFDLSWPSDFMVFISNLINRNPIISLILTACQFWSVIAFPGVTRVDHVLAGSMFSCHIMCFVLGECPRQAKHQRSL